MKEITQDWKHSVTTYIMTDNAECFAEVTEYGGNFNYIHISSLCVKEEYRKKGYAKRMLDYIEAKWNTYKHITVGVAKDAPDWLVAYYNKRGYVIWET